jgi:hypothetical protein
MHDACSLLGPPARTSGGIASEPGLDNRDLVKVKRRHQFKAHLSPPSPFLLPEPLIGAR